MAATQNSWGDTGDLINFDDGTEAVVRPMSPTDSGALLRFHGHLPAGSVRLRYFYPHNDLSPSEVARFTQVDGEARVAFVVADAYQHHGLAPMLLHRLTTAARSVGITRFTAEVLAENRAMLSVFHNAGFPIESKTEWGTVELMMTIAPDLTETATD
jgi:GNAT superfamily N-acetyltransferase